ncbi:MAG: DUF2271 domain-containing protein [Spirochaetia bacterium]|nr:DUF2271 domain-containing protein [Spirochaetia bacterium]
MKKILVLLMLFVAAALFADVEVDFEYNAMSGFASNQFALWVENESGDVVKTIFVTDFTGAKRGYKKREQSLNNWVAAAKPAEMSDSDLDAISGATPKSSAQHFTWDLTDSQGKKVPAGKYFIKLEATLFQGSNVIYTGAVDLSQPALGEIAVTMKRSEPDNTKNASMIQNVKMSVK